MTYESASHITHSQRSPGGGSELTCAGNTLCSQRCRALGRAGLPPDLALNLGKAGECEVPSLLTKTETGVRIDGLDGELADAIATGLAEYLTQHADQAGERQNIAEVKALYQSVHAARDTLYAQVLLAAKDGGMSPEELAYYQDAVANAQKQLERESKDKSTNELFLGRAAYDRECLETTGVIFTDSMVEAIEKMVVNTSLGKPTLLSGDKGIAKTQAVKYISQLIAPDKATLMVSGHGDIMSHELVGKYTQDPETGKIVFQPGPVTKGAHDGRPVLLHEVNIGDQSVVMRMQDMLLLEPGKVFALQENGLEDILIQSGFVVFMTANEGERYMGREQLDTAFRDRTDKISFTYPDASKKPLSDTMPETLRLAFAAAVDTNGRLSDRIDIADLTYLARLAHVSQQLYTQPSRNVNLEGKKVPDGGTVTRMLDDEPILSDCITPRKMIDVILRAQRNLPGVELLKLIREKLGELDITGNHNKNTVTQLVAKPKVREEVR